jgi:hypothetical protein
MLTCLLRRSYEPNALVAAHPPRFSHPHKRLVFDLACPPGTRHAGEITLTRWSAEALPAMVPRAPLELIARGGYYDYAGASDAVWHVNFADPHLFCAYGSPLLAQDELQAAEHPLLGCLREALVAEKQLAFTVTAQGPTPVLVSGVERRCELDTNADAGAGRPNGLYGNRFARASAEVVRRAVRVLAPAAPSHLIAIAAPSGGHGAYQLADIDRIVRTAYVGFAAAVSESQRTWPGAPVEIRTGFWGCGAFGGNRQLMTMLQLLAARLAGVDRLAFYVFDGDGLASYRAGEAALARVLAADPAARLADQLQQIAGLGLRWGFSDGN